jgi:hypothetical protein
MATIRVNGTVNALVHKGESWISTATVPDVCKTPTPGGPVPIPYPNISMSSTLTGGTKTVKVEGGNMAAIKGSKFSTSTGDEPGTVGGVKSSTFKQASTWITYSFDVKLDGKNACRFSDKKFQNNENTVDMAGVLPLVVAALEVDDVKMKCGELNQYGKQKKKSGKNKYDRDHIPSKAALKQKAMELKGKIAGKNKPIKLSPCEEKAIEDAALSIVTPKAAHPANPTTGQSIAQAKANAKDLAGSAKRSLKKMEKEIKKYKACQKAYKKAANKIRKITNRQYTYWLKKMLKNCSNS